MFTYLFTRDFSTAWNTIVKQLTRGPMHGIGASSATTVARDKVHWVLSDASDLNSLSGRGGLESECGPGDKALNREL
jgi:hypothetical protein